VPRPLRVLALLGLGGCNALFGVDDLGFDASGSGAAAGAPASGGGGASTATSGGGGAGGVPPASGALEWARAYAGTGVDVSRELFFTSDDHLRVTGTYGAHLDLGSAPVPDAVTDTVFVTELDEDGTPLWARAWPGGGNAPQRGPAIAPAEDGGTILAGRFADAIDFGAGAIPAAGAEDGFVAKLAPDGAVVWASTFGNAGNDAGWAVIAGPIQSSVVVGSFVGSLVVGGQTYLGHADTDGVLIGYDPSGGVYGAALFGGPGDVSPRAVARQADQIIVTGYFNGTLELPGGDLVSAGGTDVFVLAAEVGGVTWSLSLGASADDQGLDVAVGTDGIIYVVGSYQGSVLVDSETTLVAAGDDDAFLVAFDPAGTPLWAKSFGSAGEERFYSVAVDADGRLGVVGYYTADLDLGGGALPPAPGGNPAVVVAKLDAAGSPLWSHGYGVSIDQQAPITPFRALRAAAVAPTGAVAVTGFFEGTLDLGPLTSTVQEDFFVARFAP
jgi:hypothetical protein